MASASAQAAQPPPPAGPRPITHVLFDMDGLLLDTETLYTVAQSAVLAQYGHEFTREKKAQMMGKTSVDAAAWLIASFDPPLPLSPAELLAQRDALLADLFPKAKIMPGAVKLVSHLRAVGLPAAVATSSHARHFQLKTSPHASFFADFDHVVTGCQVTHGKPHPEIFLTAAGRWAAGAAAAAVDPARVLVFEDAPAGVLAARAAGMAVVFVPDARHLPEIEREAAAKMADLTISSLGEWVPEAWGLPPYNASS
jgi:HAD superfamily hydrolase (TIGR01509 family)